MELGSSLSAIVTGGASGLGEATARNLTEAGVKVSIFDMQEDRGEALAAEIGVNFCKCDVTDEASVDAALEKARAANGQERILINCAGIAFAQKTASRKRDSDVIMPHDLAAFTKVIHVNLIGTFHMASKCAAGMMSTDPITEDGGRGLIVSTASVAAVEGQVGQAAYAASKGGVAALTMPMARDLSREGIRVMAILPGLFYTPMFDTLSKEVQDALGASVPFPSRLGKPAEYAALVRHICENDMLNGETIRLDGALRMAPR
ncbi:MAG: SDR family NAD(P)-dependent oxidoreductase [Rhizobiales bacterium]|nr:SDR family NAD(P)-dependent oxidoreductase [Hyphomicrobiales bacterium]